MAWYNPFAFRPLQVTIWTTVVYLALLVLVIYTEESVPPAPAESDLPIGLSVAEAWTDLGNLTRFLHPANSHANDGVRSFLLQRVYEILEDNGMSWATQADRASVSASRHDTLSIPAASAAPDTNAGAVVFDDLLANITYSNSVIDKSRTALYFEGTNVYVYIRGTSDKEGDWWKEDSEAKSMEKQIVLVNAHYDSVPSSHGATDDGVGIVTGLQVLRYFTTPGNQPRRGVVVLFNNAEEEYLLGAAAFANSPLASYVGTFVNLEGAGAGGRVLLFRSTDLEVTTALQDAPHPFGSVLANDGFKMGLIRSETDYRTWVYTLGYRGLDLAFFTPRARYHTATDDRRHTSRDSVWHMMSTAVASAKSLSEAAGDRVDAGTTDSVWFDLFGAVLVLFPLRSLFAWSLTILAAPPLILGLILYILAKVDKGYLFRTSVLVGDAVEHEKVSIGGRKGFFRFPFALLVAGSSAYGSALLLQKYQPFIIHNSLYAVLVLMTTLFYFIFWFIMRGASFARPSAFHRAYALFWMFIISWAFLVVTAIVEDRNKIAAGYSIVFWASGVSFASLVSILEVFGLPRIGVFARGAARDAGVQQENAEGTNSSSDILVSPGRIEVVHSTSVHGSVHDGDDNATEASPLIGGHSQTARPTTFATGYRRSYGAVSAEQNEPTDDLSEMPEPYPFEQTWSGHLPSWTWLLQFLALGPCTIVIMSQLDISLGTAVHQTGTDGSNVLMPYILAAFFTGFLLLPLTPFIHRVTRHIPLLFLLVFIGTLFYCLTASPFSPSSPYKFFIRQTFSVDTGNTSIIVTGHETYVRKIIADIPSAANKPLSCSHSSGRSNGLVDCVFDGAGLEPVVDGSLGPFSSYDGLVMINATRPTVENKATLEINVVNSKSCTLHFDRPVADLFVHGSLGWDTRFDVPPREGNWSLNNFVLWRRDWETSWIVDIEWSDEDASMHSERSSSELSDDVDTKVERQLSGLSGQVICGWADANTPGTVPIIDDAWEYAPIWSILSIRSNPPPVQGSKSFAV